MINNATDKSSNTMPKNPTITDHDELTYERLLQSLPPATQESMRTIARTRHVHIAQVIKEAINAFADKFQNLRTAA